MHQSRKRPPTLTPFPCRRRPCRRLRRPPPPVGGAVESTEGGLLPDSALSIAVQPPPSHFADGVPRVRRHPWLEWWPPSPPPGLTESLFRLCFSNHAGSPPRRRRIRMAVPPLHLPARAIFETSPCCALLRRPRTPARNAEAGRLPVCMKSRALVPLCLLRFQSKLSSGAGRD